MRHVTAKSAISTALVALGLIFVGAGGAAQQEGQAGNQARGQRAGKHALAKQQLEVIDRALSDLDRLVKAGEIRIPSKSLILWRRRRLDAVRASGAGKPEIVAEAEKYVSVMKRQEDAMNRLFESNNASRTDLFDAQFQRIEAELLLDEEQNR